MEIQKLLPETSFVPFKARRLICANVVYANLELFHEYGYFKNFDKCSDEFYSELLNYFAYIVPKNDEDLALVSNVEREFLAERYGGAGILANGGGARCGLSGPFSLKGIGPTPLVGEGVDFWYSHGRMGLEEAISELFYSELTQTALPISSSRILAVIDTGGTILQRSFRQSINPHDDECKLVPAGIIVRETKIRPAHFGRAFYFKPTQYMKENYVHDHQRVRNVISFLPKAVGINDNRVNTNQKFYLAIESILANSALQLAYSKVRRLMHGSLGFSNILVNGGWIDFGSATVVPSYEQLITAELQPSYWDEVYLFQKTSADLCFYVRKFQPNTQLVIGNGMEMHQKFLDFYIQHLRTLLIELTGMPLFFLKELVNNEWYKKLGSILLHVARMENENARISNWVLHAEEPSHTWSKKSIRTILQTLFHHYWIENKTTAPILPLKQHVADDLWANYTALSHAIESLLVGKNISRESLICFTAYNMARQLMGVVPFYRGHMLNAIAEQLNKSSSPVEFRNNIESLHTRYNLIGTLHYVAPTGTQLLLAINKDGMRLIWDLEQNHYRIEIPVNALIEYAFSSDAFLSYASENKRVVRNLQMDGKGEFIFGYFHQESIGSDLNINEIYITENEKSFTLDDFFPEFENFYLNFRVAINGSEIPADSCWMDNKVIV